MTEQDKTQSTHCGVVALTSNSGIVTLNELVRDDNVVTVSQMKSQGKLTEVVMMVQLMLCEYLDNVSLRSSMNEQQIELAAGLMVEKHQHLPVQSFQLFFEECLCRTYGDHYGRMDIPTLMGWLQKFHKSYDEMVDEQAYQAHQSTKGDNANFVDIVNRHKALGCSEEDEPIPMPDDMFIKIKENNLRRQITDNVFQQNKHLYKQMSVKEADEKIDELVQIELLSNGIFN